MKNKPLILFLLFIFACNLEHVVPTNPDLNKDDLRAHIAVLASDYMKGRQAGTDYELKSARYIARRFKSYGLQPLTDHYFQEFDFISGVKPGPDNTLELEGISRNLGYGSDYRTLGFSSSAFVESDLVFAGYGIVAPQLDHNDYQDLDIKDKTVIVMRFSPDGKDPAGDFYDYSPLRKKAIIARENGAAAILFVTGSLNDESGMDRLKSLDTRSANAEVGIPAIHIKRSVINDLLRLSGQPDLETLQSWIDEKDDRYTGGFSLDQNISLKSDVTKISSTSQNVVGIVPGNGSLKDEWLVIGAHYDHLGMGGSNSNSMVPEVEEIHNGADDNASGTAGVIELAEFYGHIKSADNQRSILFITFGSEEVGLLGSSYFTENPLIPLENIVAMINMDMIGRPENNSLIIGGAGTSSIWKDLITAKNTAEFNIIFNDEGYASSDHTPFFLKDIPVLFFFTGAHMDYHRPSDDIELIDFPGLLNVTRLVLSTAEEIITQPDRPDFIKVESSSHGGGGRGYAVTIGIIPDFAYIGSGLKINAARENAPAGKVGMQTGDIIVEFNSVEILNIHDYMFVLQEINPGDTVPITILRGDNRIELMIRPEPKAEE